MKTISVRSLSPTLTTVAYLRRRCLFIRSFQQPSLNRKAAQNPSWQRREHRKGATPRRFRILRRLLRGELFQSFANRTALLLCSG
ncbi:MAG: hypothetical protein ABIZ04_12310 [Opitutus sp.]